MSDTRFTIRNRVVESVVIYWDTFDPEGAGWAYAILAAKGGVIEVDLLDINSDSSIERVIRLVIRDFDLDRFGCLETDWVRESRGDVGGASWTPAITRRRHKKGRQRNDTT